MTRDVDAARRGARADDARAAAAFEKDRALEALRRRGATRRPRSARSRRRARRGPRSGSATRGAAGARCPN